VITAHDESAPAQEVLDMPEAETGMIEDLSVSAADSYPGSGYSKGLSREHSVGGSDAYKEEDHASTVPGDVRRGPSDVRRLRSTTQCGRGALVGLDPATGRGLIIPARCKAWDCPTCGPRKRNKWIAILASGRPTKVLTLTADPKISTILQERAEKMKAAFTILTQRIRAEIKRHPKLRWLPPRPRRLKRRAMKARGETTTCLSKEEFEYALVWELQGQAHLHCHVLLRSPYIPWGWLRWHWSHLGIGTHVHIKEARAASWEANHAAKRIGQSVSIGPLHPSEYVTKESSATATAIAPLRLVQCSEGYAPTDAKQKTDAEHAGWLWIPVYTNAGDLAADLLTLGRIAITSVRPDGTIEFKTPVEDIWSLDLDACRRSA
jgi:hypothetical protein